MGWAFFLSHPEMESRSVCRPPARRDGLAGEPRPSAEPVGSRGSPGCGSAGCPEPYAWQAGTGRLLASSKAPPHQKLYVGNGKELHSTHSACFLPWSTHWRAGLGVGSHSRAAAALSMFQSRRCNSKPRSCSSGVRELSDRTARPLF